MKSLKRDNSHHNVMYTFTKAQEDEDLEFKEALEFAVDRGKFLIICEFEYEDGSDILYTSNDNILQ